MPRKQHLGLWLLSILLLATLTAAFPAYRKESLIHKARLVRANVEILNGALDQWIIENGKTDDALPAWANIEFYLPAESTLRASHGRDIFGNSFIVGTGEEYTAIHPDTLARLSTVLNVAEFFGESDGRRLPPEIIVAARSGDAARVRALVESGVNIDEPDHYGFTPLHWAAKLGHVEVARTICSMHPMPTVAIRAGTSQRPNCTALVEAVAAGHTPVLQVFRDYGIKLDDQRWRNE